MRRGRRAGGALRVRPGDLRRAADTDASAEASAPLDLRIQDWRRELFTSPPGVEQHLRYDRFGDRRYGAAALGGRLHWASTETALESPGHIEGALAAAERAVDAVTRALDQAD